jgi:hypothetical protein
MALTQEKHRLVMWLLKLTIMDLVPCIDMGQDP